MSEIEKWQTISSKVVFDRRRVRLVEDIVRLPSGEETEYLVLRAGPGVAVLAATADGRAVLTQEYRHPIGETIYCLPGGGIRRGETLEESARRELVEEAGFQADVVLPLGTFYPSPARASTEVHVFFARGLTAVPRVLESTEQIFVHRLPWQDVLAMATRGEIRDATTIFALFMAEKKGLI